MAISPELRAFLADWLAWVERGAPDGEPYTRRWGLCTNSLSHSDAAFACLAQMLDDEFGDNSGYPFGLGAYTTAKCKGTQHRSRKRLAWVRAKLSEPVQ